MHTFYMPKRIQPDIFFIVKKKHKLGVDHSPKKVTLWGTFKPSNRKNVGSLYFIREEANGFKPGSPKASHQYQCLTPNQEYKSFLIAGLKDLNFCFLPFLVSVLPLDEIPSYHSLVYRIKFLL